MLFTLNNVNYTITKATINQELSEETLCFYAEIIAPDGTKYSISNRGHGGPNLCTPSLKGLGDDSDTDYAFTDHLLRWVDVKKRQSKSILFMEKGVLTEIRLPNSIKTYVDHGLAPKVQKIIDDLKEEGLTILNWNLKRYGLVA